MLKYFDCGVTFAEFPDEITLCINIANCPNRCKGCCEPFLQEDIGEALTETTLSKLIDNHPGISCIGFMGGDNDQETLESLAQFIKLCYHLKVGVYSGLDEINTDLIPYVDYYKIGRWIQPQGDEKDWPKTNCGPIKFPFSNQLMFKIERNKIVNITHEFRKDAVSNLSSYIISGETEC